MSIARKSAFDAASQVGIVLMSMIAGIFVSRMLGDTGRGAYVLATFLANLLLMNFASFGMRLSLQVFAAKERDRIAELHTFAVLFCIGAGLLVGTLIFLFAGFVQQILLRGIPFHYLVVIAACAPFGLYHVAWVGLMNGLGEIRRRAIIDFAYGMTQSISVIAILLFIRDEPIRLLVYSYYGLQALFALVMFIAFAGSKSWHLPGRDLVRQIIGYGKWVYVGNFAAQLRGQLDQLIANYAGSQAILGVYNQAASLASRALLPAAALETSAYRPITASDSAEAGRLVCASFRQMLIFSAAVFVVGWFCAPLIPIIYGPEFAESILPFRVLLAATCLLGSTRMIVIYFSGHLADPRLPMIVNWVTVALQFALTFFMIRQFGVLNGVTWATAITFIVTSLIFITAFLIRKETPSPFELIRFRREDITPWLRLLRR